MKRGGFRKGQYHLNDAASSTRISQKGKEEESNRLKSDVPLMKWVEVGSSKENKDSEILPCPIIPFIIKKITFSSNDIKRNIRIPNRLTKEVAEDVGIQVGDGSLPIYIDKRNFSHYVIGTYGNKIEDRKYFEEFVVPLKEKLFRLKLEVRNHKSGGTCYIKTESKALFNFYHKIFGLPHGSKSKNLKIPELILNSDIQIKNAFIRGVADTDFSLTFKKDSKGIHRYPYIQLNSASRNLVVQITDIMKKENKINSTTVLDVEEKNNQTGKFYKKHYLNIHGRKNLEKWIVFIGFHNPVQITKYDIWKKFGFCPPRTTLNQRLAILNGQIEPQIFGR